MAKKIKVIAIHGPTTSGKTTFCDNLHAMIKDEVRVMKIHLDDYYKTCSHVDVHDFDFDNPAVLDWTKIHALIRSINDGDEYLPTYSYDFVTRESVGPKMIKNTYPQVLIVEGCYALNIFNN